MQKKYYYLLFLPILVVYVINLFVDVMAVDAAQYAEMSWEMFTSHSFLKVHMLGADYLDKPPLLFWLNSFSFYLFGVGNVSYKLPSLLFALLAIYSTYRFARLYYTAETAITASLMLASTEALFLITNDVRTDTVLMGAVIFAIWQWASYFETRQTVNIICGSIGIGTALLAKGPIGMIAVVAALLPHILLSKKLKWLLDARLITGFAIIALMLAPMCLGLYQQWGWTGLKFYFWTQSFGRITGSSEWNNNPDTFFLVHTTAWAFLPWTLFLFAGWADTAISLVRRRMMPQEIISISGFTLVLIALMLSRYQLPHYIFVVYPLGAVIAADYMDRMQKRVNPPKAIFTLQLAILICLIAISCALQFCLKGADPISISCLTVLYMATIAVVIYSNGPIKRWQNIMLYPYRNLFLLSIAIMTVFNLLMGAFYFPAIIKYQPENDFGRYVRQSSQNKNFVTYFRGAGSAEVFYAHQVPVAIWDTITFREHLNVKKQLLVFTIPYGIRQLKITAINYKIIEQRFHYPVSKLTPDFLNPAKRPGICDTIYLVEAKL